MQKITGKQIKDVVAGDGIVKDANENLKVNVNTNRLKIANDIVDLVTGSMVEVYRNATQSIPSSSNYTKVQFNSKVVDSLNEFDISTNYRFTATKAGRFLVTCTVGFPKMKGYRGIALYKNGSTTNKIVGHEDDSQLLASSNTIQQLNFSHTIDLDIGDYIEIWVRQQDSGNINIDANTTRLTITQLIIL